MSFGLLERPAHSDRSFATILPGWLINLTLYTLHLPCHFSDFRQGTTYPYDFIILYLDILGVFRFLDRPALGHLYPVI